MPKHKQGILEQVKGTDIGKAVTSALAAAADYITPKKSKAATPQKRKATTAAKGKTARPKGTAKGKTPARAKR
jgi:hypothetical protein